MSKKQNSYQSCGNMASVRSLFCNQASVPQA